MKAIDASLVLKIVVWEDDSARAHAIWDEWRARREVLVAPPLFVAETISALRRLVYRGKLDAVPGEEAFAALRRLPVETVEPGGLYERAWALARELSQPNIYDCIYPSIDSGHRLALAESLGCPDLSGWTADAGLARAARPRFPWVRTLGEIQHPKD